MPRQGLEEFSYENVGSTVATPPLLSENSGKIGKPEEVNCGKRSSSIEKVKSMSSSEVSAEALRGQEDSSRLWKHGFLKKTFLNLTSRRSSTTSVGTTLLKREGSVAPSVYSLRFRHIAFAGRERES